ncbi:nucleotidyltransferase domain-containing protein [Microcella sp.]|uniref:nucleotidyltransferase domain-containing protein n=1 Tax=Microcella sp. TaxID=1913979 RepID=UPI0025690C5F|nr:nucleotidyltransferase domain-containing protein [Microcella sp.]MBX9472344.1 nucleotidyltransferase domain-containing protein [Microcella sp.]
MQLDAPLRTVTASVDGDVLSVLARSDSEHTVADLRRIIDSRSSEGIRRALHRLVAQGVVLNRHVGRSIAYRLNVDHLAANAIVELSAIPSTLRTRITHALEESPDPPLFAAMFGSAARGSMTEHSDIDIALIHRGTSTEPRENEIAALEHDISLWTGNDCRVLSLTEAEIRGQQANEPVLVDILNHAITLYGDREAFRALIRPQ